MAKNSPRNARQTAPRKRARAAAAQSPPAPERGFRFGPVNYAAMGAGALAIVAGYVLLDGGSVTAAPILLILGYMVLLPAGIMLGWRKPE
jgi:hypothetical protein